MTTQTNELTQDRKCCLLTRSRLIVNTDPQRRCYHGCHFSSEMIWSEWETLDRVVESRTEAKLKFWKELNDYAVSQRGESARREFKVVPEELCGENTTAKDEEKA